MKTSSTAAFAAALVFFFAPLALAENSVWVFQYYEDLLCASLGVTLAANYVSMGYSDATTSAADCAAVASSTCYSDYYTDDDFAASGNGLTYYTKISCVATLDAGIPSSAEISFATYDDGECLNANTVSAYESNVCTPYKNFESYIKTSCDGGSYKMLQCTDAACSDCEETLISSSGCEAGDGFSSLFEGCYAPTKLPVPAPTKMPVPAPTKMPVPAPTKMPVPVPTAASDDVCFSGEDTLILESGEAKRLSEVAIGDKVQTADAGGVLSFSEVVALPHAANNKLASFVNVATTSGKSVKATKMHLLQQCDGTLTYAGSLTAGDCLRTADGDEAVTAVSMTTAEGIYTAVTNNEFLVVNGIVASPFAVTHGLTNAYYNVHRIAAKVFPSALKSPLVLAANAFLGGAFLTAGGSK